MPTKMEAHASYDNVRTEIGMRSAYKCRARTNAQRITKGSQAVSPSSPWAICALTASGTGGRLKRM